MNAFQINLTPNRQKTKVVEGREPTLVILAPFTPKAVVMFDNVPCSKTAKRLLRVQNPSDDEIEVNINKGNSTDLNLRLEWTSKTIPANGEVEMELVWSPLVDGTFKHTILFADNRNFKKDVSVILKSVPLKIKNAVKKFPSLSSSNVGKKTSTTASLKPALAASSKKQIPGQQKTPTQKVRQISTATVTKRSSSTAFSSPLQNANSSIDKEIYLTPVSKSNEKENCSPAHSKDMFDNLQMTPLSSCNKLPDNKMYLEYLASLPTPTYKPTSENIEPKSALCPRKLKVEASPDSSPRASINKTFNINGRNIQITVSSELDVIEEEGGKTTQQAIQSPINRSKLDINLIGTPLRKYSESMRDLSTHKIATPGSQGSMPNLNEMDFIRSIENNRYFNSRADLDDSISECNDLKFNKSEILAQSSRYHLNEIDRSPKRFREKESTEFLEVSSSTQLSISPPKKARFDESMKPPMRRPVRKPQLNSSSRNSTLKLTRKPVKPASPYNEKRTILYDSDLYLQKCINPDPFAATTTCDPFLASTMYLDERSILKHAAAIKKWLNALVSIPADFDSECDKKIDIGKLFNEVRNKELSLAPSKEEQSLNYLTSVRMNNLRNSAIALFLGPEMREICSKIAVHIKKKSMAIREDRNLHLDVVTQRYILELLLMFNPLWLRIGLEVTFGEIIHLQSNSDIYGLSTFIINRLFKDKYLEQKHNRAYVYSNEYSDYIKKFTLQKFLFLLLFLNKAKEVKIIKHNPCLFIKSSPYKELREILLKFSSELLANVGDITRDLKRLGFVLTHKQHFIDEFDYAFNNLAVDLRDGIRITKVTEIICLRDDLTTKLRVPAISRLQRIHNVNLALNSLSELKFQLGGNITAADIVDGHREKTLSLLWQLIYKFRSPKFHAAAKTIQGWWKNIWLKVVISRRIKERELARRESAALLIQKHYRGYISRKDSKAYIFNRIHATVILQKYVRGFIARKKFDAVIYKIRSIQLWYRATRLAINTRAEFIFIKANVILIQRWYKRMSLANRLIAASKVIKHVIENERSKNKKAYIIQKFLKSVLIRRKFQDVVKNVCRMNKAAILIQATWKMYISRKDYIIFKEKVIIIQRIYQNYKLGKTAREKFLQQRTAATRIQIFYRNYRIMAKLRNSFLKLKENVTNVQIRWRALVMMRNERQHFEKLKKSTIYIQRLFRANRKMRLQRRKYVLLRNSTIYIQQCFRSYLMTKLCRAHYKGKLAATVYIQQYFRNYLKMKTQKNIFQNKKQKCIVIQRKFRAYLVMKRVRETYLKDLQRITFVQHKFKAKLKARLERKRYLETRNVIIHVQRKFRRKLMCRDIRKQFLKMKTSAIKIQKFFRGYLLMRKEKADFERKCNAVIKIQKYFKNYLEMKNIREGFLEIRRATLTIQTWYKSILSMRGVQRKYILTRNSVIQIQRLYRSKKLTEKLRNEYLRKRDLIIFTQRKFFSLMEMRRQRKLYLRKKSSAVKIQQWYRSHLQSRQIRSQYLLLRSLTICIQRKHRANLKMKIQREEYLNLKEKVIFVQEKFRGKLLTRSLTQQLVVIKKVTFGLQTHIRGFMARERFRALMTPEMIKFIKQKFAARIIQRWWRGYCIRKRWQDVRIRTIRTHAIEMRKTRRTFNTVRSRINECNKILKGRYSANDALAVLLRYEKLSRTVPHLLIDTSDFISTFCYGIMAQAIRSEVDKQLIEFCSRIILNLARYNSTTANTFQENGLVTIAQMLLRWCDKDCDIFNTLCTLIYIFSHCPKKRRKIREFMTTPEAIYVVRETKKLVARKEKMKQNVRKPTPPTLVNLGKTANKPTLSSRSYPSIEPDYGVVRTKPYIFISSVFGFDTILQKLGIEIV